jgi:hypothetical protein
MKIIRSIFLVILFTISTLVFSGCLKNELLNNYQEPPSEEEKYGSFDFKTVKEHNVLIVTLNNQDQPIDGVYIEVFTANPLKKDGTLVANYESSQIFKGSTDLNGMLTIKINPATKTDSLYILTYHIGLPSILQIPLNDSYVDVILGGKNYPKLWESPPFQEVIQILGQYRLV